MIKRVEAIPVIIRMSASSLLNSLRIDVDRMILSIYFKNNNSFALFDFEQFGNGEGKCWPLFPRNNSELLGLENKKNLYRTGWNLDFCIG